MSVSSLRGTGRSPSPVRLFVGFVVFAWAVLASLTAAGQEDTSSTTSTTAPATTAAPTTAASSETSASESTSTTQATTITTVDSRAKAEAVANLNLAKAADVEIAQELNNINSAANGTLEKIDEAQARIDEADRILKRTAEDLDSSAGRQSTIEEELRLKAVEGFKSRTIGAPQPLLTDADLNRAIRRNALLAQASLSTAELLEELRGLLEERQLANARASQAKTEAEQAQLVLQAELDVYKEQQASQLKLKAEAERRIDQWAGELAAYAREDAAVQQIISTSSSKAEVDTSINNPSSASLAGFQWPVEARVTSEFGYRIHPVYGTRRLHAGIDVGAPSGTPIYAANDGIVIFAGGRGGYGSTVIVDHGGGITTLYAHMSRIGSNEGQLVARGDVVGFVGATGTATGNHLHFEVRVDGGPVNPRNYLP